MHKKSLPGIGAGGEVTAGSCGELASPSTNDSVLRRATHEEGEESLAIREKVFRVDLSQLG